MLATPERTANRSIYHAHRHRAKMAAFVTKKICFRTNANVHEVSFGSSIGTRKTQSLKIQINLIMQFGKN